MAGQGVERMLDVRQGRTMIKNDHDRGSSTRLSIFEFEAIAEHSDIHSPDRHHQHLEIGVEL